MKQEWAVVRKESQRISNPEQIWEEWHQAKPLQEEMARGETAAGPSDPQRSSHEQSRIKIFNSATAQPSIQQITERNKM